MKPRPHYLLEEVINNPPISVYFAHGQRACRSEGENIVFMKNLGGVNGCAGEWSICGGNSQSYADASVCEPGV